MGDAWSHLRRTPPRVQACSAMRLCVGRPAGRHLLKASFYDIHNLTCSRGAGLKRRTDEIAHPDALRGILWPSGRDGMWRKESCSVELRFFAVCPEAEHEQSRASAIRG